jgi:hypothetical protein
MSQHFSQSSHAASRETQKLCACGKEARPDHWDCDDCHALESSIYRAGDYALLDTKKAPCFVKGLALLGLFSLFLLGVEPARASGLVIVGSPAASSHFVSSRVVLRGECSFMHRARCISICDYSSNDEGRTTGLDSRHQVSGEGSLQGQKSSRGAPWCYRPSDDVRETQFGQGNLIWANLPRLPYGTAANALKDRGASPGVFQVEREFRLAIRDREIGYPDAVQKDPRPLQGGGKIALPLSDPYCEPRQNCQSNRENRHYEGIEGNRVAYRPLPEGFFWQFWGYAILIGGGLTLLGGWLCGVLRK